MTSYLVTIIENNSHQTYVKICLRDMRTATGRGTGRDRERPYAYRALSILHKTYSCFLALLSIRDCLK